MTHDLAVPHARLRALALAAQAASREFRYEEALNLGHEAIALAGLDPSASPAAWDAHTQGLDRETVESLATVSTALAICSFRQGDYLGSMHLAQLEVHLRRHLGDAAGEAMAVLGLGWCYHAAGLYQHALSNQFEALDALEKVGPHAMAGPLNGIARVYLDLGQPELALEYGQRALAAAPTSPNFQRDTSTALRVIGQAYQRKGDLEGARRAFRESYERSDAYGQRLALLSLGELSLEEGRFEEAQARFEECLERLSPERRELVQCQALLGLGRVFVARGEPERALAPLAAAVERGSASGAPVDAAAAHKAMSEALKSLGRWEEALAHHERFHELNERTLMQLSDRRTQVLQVQLDVERVRKDREIDRLRNVELAQAYADLRQLHKQLEVQAARLERLSRTDALTGVHNRRAFEEQLGAELLRFRRGGRTLSLLMVDLDDFKRVNDTYSHVVGDGVLRATAEALLACTREIDLVARLGGEEFVVLLPETDADGAARVANKVLEVVTQRTRAAQDVHITASVGVATADELDDETTLLMRADNNLYEAKRLGKNRVNA